MKTNAKSEGQSAKGHPQGCLGDSPHLTSPRVHAKPSTNTPSGERNRKAASLSPRKEGINGLVPWRGEGRGEGLSLSSFILRHSSFRSCGYILFELVLAITIFSIAVLGLAKALNQSLDTANLLKRDQIVRIGMRNFFEEIRRKPLTDMSTSSMDTTYGITYTSTTEPVSLRTTNGSTLQDLYNVTIKATSEFNGIPEEATLSVYVHKPAQQ
jgi:type II secretory pathway pseudopilin PulG